MINGLMDFEGIPLETLISEFKSEIDEFTSVEKIKKDFIAFLSKNTSYTTSEEYLKWVLATFKTRLHNLIEEDGFKTAVNSKLTKEIPDFLKQYPHFENEFYDIIPDTLDKKHYNLKIWKIFSFELNFEGTGIIIAGFDKTNHYASLAVFNIYCNDHGKIITQEVESITNCEDPLIRIYALNEEAYAFITGVSTDFENYLKYSITNSFKEIKENIAWFLKNKNIEDTDNILSVLDLELKDSYDILEKIINNYKEDAIKDTSDACEFIPRQLICEFADSLIKLTALKQKLSLDLETVSSETDIALITKTDNFKWVKYTDEII